MIQFTISEVFKVSSTTFPHRYPQRDMDLSER